jgi:hypothetical protein
MFYDNIETHEMVGMSVRYENGLERFSGLLDHFSKSCGFAMELENVVKDGLRSPADQV